MNRLLTVSIAVLALLAGTLTSAAPVADDDRVGIDFRRTTLVVRDIEASLAFYRDALGMVVIYDNLIRTPREAASDAEADRSLRLVFLRANDDFIGVLGLLEYRKPRKPALVQGLEPFTPGSSVLLFNTRDLETRFAEARMTPGVRVLSEPAKTSYPSYDGSGTIDVMVSVLTDPDGFVVELNQLLTDDLGRRTPRPPPTDGAQGPEHEPAAAAGGPDVPPRAPAPVTLTSTRHPRGP